MTWTASAAHGVKIKIGDGASPEVFTEIPGVHNGPSGPSFEPQMIEQRHHGSVDPVQKPTIVKKAPVTFDILYDSSDTQHAALITAAKDLTRENFKMELQDAGAEIYAFGAYVQATFKGEVEGFNVYSISLNVDGAITIS